MPSVKHNGVLMVDKNRIPVRVKLGYGVGALSYAIPFQVLSGFFLFYAKEVLGISGTIAGMVLSISIFWDAFTDPVMGYISDKTSSKVLFGRRLFYVLIGALGLAAANLFLWNIDNQMPMLTKSILLIISLLLVKTFATIYTTPYLALGAELSNDYDERTSVQSFRTAFFFLGFLFPTIVGIGIFFKPTAQFEVGQLNPQAYSLLAITTSAIVIVCAALSIIFTRNKSLYPEAVKSKKSSILGMFKETAIAFKCDDFRNIAISLLFVNMAMGIVSAVGLHTFTFTFGFNNKEITLIFGSLFAMALAGQPLWVVIARKFEKKQALKFCLIINICVSIIFIVCVFLNNWISEHFLSVLPLALLMGFSIGGSIALPYAMISDTVDKDAYYTGVRKEGVFYGCATFLYKVSQSLAVLFVGVLLDIIKFNSELVQPNSVYIKLGLILPIGFFICFFGALIFTQKYSLNKEKVATFQHKKL